LRGVEVHNLKQIDLDLQHGRLIVICGLSGSGKTSLALDTIYAEGQRRYIESFSAYTRQFLERLEKPAAERIDGIPPAIAVTHSQTARSSRSTVGSLTEATDYLRLLFARIAKIQCYGCGQEVRRDSPELAAEKLATLPAGLRMLIAFPVAPPSGKKNLSDVLNQLREEGYVRVILGERLLHLGETSPEVLLRAAEEALAVGHDSHSTETDESEADESEEAQETEEEEQPGTNRRSAESLPQSKRVKPTDDEFDDETSDHDKEENGEVENGEIENGEASEHSTDIEDEPSKRKLHPAASKPGGPLLYAVVDRLVSGAGGEQRLRDSLETAFNTGQGVCQVLLDPASAEPNVQVPLAGIAVQIDGKPWLRRSFTRGLRCEDCGIDYPEPEPRLFNFNSPLGACPECEGFGNVIGVDMELVVPDAGKSLREGAIAPWNTPAYAHELNELLALAGEYKLPVDIPYRQLQPEHLELIQNGVPEKDFGGLRGFFHWLERRKYKMHLRVFLSRWRSYRPCPRCQGARLRPEALAARIAGRNIAELCRLKISDARNFVLSLKLTDWQRSVGRVMLDQVESRLRFLEEVGLGYLSLDRTLRTLSGGETQRVALTTALGSSLVNMLYVLDEPSVGLHPRDVDRLVQAILRLRDRKNTVVVVEHEESLIRAADQVVEIGPGAGEQGGRVVFQGTPAEMQLSERSLTGAFLTGERGASIPEKRRRPDRGWIRLAGARGNNLKNVTVEFPLGVLCLVTGVSGAGKSTLVQDTLYPALCRRMRKEGGKPLEYDDVFGDGQVEDVILVDQSPIGRSPRSNPVTYIKAFDAIREVFSETIDARTHNFGPSHFSFNVEGGRCTACRGDGYIEIDMQFMADVFMKCAQCGGKRYRKEILAVRYRGRNIAEVLAMTVREAFTFFRGHGKVQARLKRLMDVGLDYLRLGQPANTLSGGESQRLKLAGYLSATRKGRTLFLLDEPTTGLHFSDVVQLLDCFDSLLAVGHSLIVVEHNLQMMKAADYIIDLGPGAADEGGEIIAEGPPEVVARNTESATAAFLREALSLPERELI
jgi:excinuclease ABC subunit A